MNLLYVDCCISLHEESRTCRLANTFLNAWKAAHPLSTVEVLDIRSMDLRPLDADAVLARETAAQAGRADAPELALAKQFARADRIVISAPFWELSFPAKLRTYLEHVSVAGVTFTYSDHGNVGLCNAGKLLFLSTAGGPFAPNCGSDHLRALCGLFGISSYEFIGAPMQDVQEVDSAAILEGALTEARTLAHEF